MKHFATLVFCLLSAMMHMNFICAQESDLLKECTIPATDNHGTIKFGIVVPPSYENSPGSYPVIYYMHGLNGYYAGPRAEWLASFFHTQFTEGRLPECILVFPDGGEGFWCDHYDGDPMLETEIVNYLIPHMDKNYRTIPSKRLTMGYSAGGMGAVSFYVKHPELFAAAISLDGSIVTWEEFLYFQGNRPEIFENADYYYEYSPFKWVELNRKALTQNPDTSIFLSAGFLVDPNKEFLSLLEAEEIPARFVEFGYDHEFGYVFSESQEELLKFLAKKLK